jgi:hypothetical protein
MKLYLNMDLPDGMKMKYIDPVTKKVRYDKLPVRLFPYDATEVNESDAVKLLEQSPHQVSKAPFKTSPAAVSISNGITEEEKKSILLERATSCLAVLDEVGKDFSFVEIKSWAKKLEIELPQDVQANTVEQNREICFEILLDGITKLLDSKSNDIADIPETAKPKSAAGRNKR